MNVSFTILSRMWRPSRSVPIRPSQRLPWFLRIVTAILVSVVTTVSADSRRTATLMVGTLAPSGSSAPYADGGLLLAGRLNKQVQAFPALSFWAEANIQVLDQRSSLAAKDQSNAYTGIVGAQLGSSSERALIRPRVALGLGIFGVETRKTLLGGSSLLNDTSTANQSVDFRLRPGMRVSTGIDFFFSPSWGLGVEFFWEDIFALRASDPDNNVSGSVKFQGASFCVVLPLGHK